MLAQHADFPHVGALAFEIGTARPVTILGVNADADQSRICKIHGSYGASATRTLPLKDLVATEAEAFNAKLKPRRRVKGRGQA